MSEEFSFRDIVELAQDVIIVTRAEPLDAPGPVIVYVNPAFTRLTGYTREEAIGQNPRILQGIETDKETLHAIRLKLDKAEPLHVAIENYAKDGRSYWLDLSIMPLRDANGKTTHFVAIERDVSLQKELERKLVELSIRDPLTGLFNRRRYYEAIDASWSRFRNMNEAFAVIDLDIDLFKSFNDRFGHDFGDEILKEIASVIRSCCRPEDVAARVGGEEFSVILDRATAEFALETAERIRKRVESEPIRSQAAQWHVVTVSLGIAVADARDAGPDRVTKRADDAMYQSKRQGRNRSTYLEFGDVPDAPPQDGKTGGS